jgi:hypothetical protein
LNRVEFFGWLLWKSIDLAVYAWPLTLGLLVVLVVAIVRQYRRDSPGSSIPWTLIALGFAFPLAILVYGSIQHATGPNWTPRPGAHLAPGIVYGILGLQIVFVGSATWRARNARGIVGALGACQLWWSMGAGFITIMAVTGDWL